MVSGEGFPHYCAEEPVCGVDGDKEFRDVALRPQGAAGGYSSPQDNPRVEELIGGALAREATDGGEGGCREAVPPCEGLPGDWDHAKVEGDGTPDNCSEAVVELADGKCESEAVEGVEPGLDAL